MQHNEEAITKAIEQLEFVRERPGIDLGTPSEQTVMNWLSGFEAACYAFGLPLTLEFRREAANKRGWEFPAAGPAKEMRERGYTEAQVVDELLMIEITMLRSLFTPQQQ